MQTALCWGSCSCLRTLRDIPCTLQMRKLELGGVGSSSHGQQSWGPKPGLLTCNLAALWPLGPNCTFFEYDFWFSWRIPDFSHKEHCVHWSNYLNVMLAIIFYDEKIDSLFSWPVGIPKNSPDHGTGGSQLPQVSADCSHGNPVFSYPQPPAPGYGDTWGLHMW